jgi:hypothetical protein
MLEELTDAARKGLAPHWQRAFEFVEELIGGRIVRAQLHPRWRPAYYLDVETKRHGVQVPHVYGFCEDPRGIVMERVEGRPDLSTAESPEEARAVLDDFVDLLARMHQIDVEELGDLGLKVPRDAEEIALGDLDHWIASYRKNKVRPDPLIEFLLRWVHANVPRGRRKVALLQGDPGQFLFDAGRVTAMVDLELAYLGDPAADLAGLFARDLWEPMPSLIDALERYGERTGEPVDPRVVMYHGVRFNLTAPLSMAHIVAEPPADTEFIQYMAWLWVSSRTALEWMAKLEGVDLDPWTPSDETETRYSAGHDFLDKALRVASPEQTMVKYQLDVAARAASYLRRADRWGRVFDEEDLDEAAAILGERPASWQEADAELEALVLDNAPDPGLDIPLLRLLHRRCLRQEWLMKSVLGERAGVSFQPLGF